MKNDLKLLVGENEKILYEGKPNKKCFIFESIFNPLLPFAIIWAIIDFGMLGGVVFAGEGSMLLFMIPFMLLHMMPVWLYLGGVLLMSRIYKNTEYIVTDHAIYVSGGVFSKTFKTKPFAELSHVDLHRGIFDQMFNVGDIITTSSQYSTNNAPATISIKSVSNYVEVYNIVKKLQRDIYTDVMYPNDKRPKENHGYKTEYKG